MLTTWVFDDKFFFSRSSQPIHDTNLIPGELVQVHFLQAKRLGIIDNFFQERLSDDIVAFLAGAGWNEAYAFRKRIFKIFLLPGINLVYLRPFRKIGHYPREFLNVRKFQNKCAFQSKFVLKLVGLG